MLTEIDTLIQEYGDAIRASDNAALRLLTSEWIKIEIGLESDIYALAAEIERRKLAGEIITEQMLWKMDSYKRTLVKMETLIAEYSDSAGSYILGTQKDAYLLGVSKANGLVMAELHTAGLNPPYRERLNQGAVQAALNIMNERNPFYKSLYEAYGDSANAFRSALAEGIARGQGVTQLATSMRDAIGIGLNRSLVIAQTEMSRAYRTGTIAQYRSTGVVTYYVRLVKKETACLACLALDGQKYALAEDMQDHPRGFCDVIAKVQGVPLPTWEKGSTWLRNQDAERQREIMGSTRYEMWKEGTKLNDFITLKDDPVWGKQPAIVPIGEIH